MGCVWQPPGPPLSASRHHGLRSGRGEDRGPDVVDGAVEGVGQGRVSARVAKGINRHLCDVDQFDQSGDRHFDHAAVHDPSMSPILA